MLNGADEKTDTGETGTYSRYAQNDMHKNTNIYTPKNCLLATFPQELQNAIGRRIVKYDPIYNKKTEDNLDYSTDKLWLFSHNELGDRVSAWYSNHPLEGTVYPKFKGIGDICSGPNPRLAGYTVKYGNVEWWLRSSHARTTADSPIWVSWSNYIGDSVAGGSGGVAPGFTLKR